MKHSKKEARIYKETHLYILQCTRNSARFFDSKDVAGSWSLLWKFGWCAHGSTRRPILLCSSAGISWLGILVWSIFGASMPHRAVGHLSKATGLQQQQQQQQKNKNNSKNVWLDILPPKTNRSAEKIVLGRRSGSLSSEWNGPFLKETNSFVFGERELQKDIIYYPENSRMSPENQWCISFLEIGPF